MRPPLLLLIAGSAAAQTPTGTWALLPNSPLAFNRHNDGSFVSPHTGFVIVGAPDAGGIYATDDGGGTWEARGTLPVWPRSVGFVTAEVGWVGTLYGTTDQHLFETRDGGRTFTNVADRIQGDPILGICGISVVSPQVVYGAGWCCGGGAGIVKTADGGQTWQATRLDSLVDFLIDVHFFNESRGIAVGGSLGGHAAVIGTEDGGQTWALRHVSGDETEWGWKITFPDPDTGYVAIEHHRFDDPDGKVFKTTDGGLTWADVIIPEGGSLQGVGFATANVGWTSGRGVRSETTDGGGTWTRYTGAFDGDVNRFRMLSDTLGYAFGQRVYKYSPGPGTEAEPPPPAAPAITVYPNPAADRVSFAFSLRQSGHADLSIYDLQGRQLAVVARRTFPAGTHVLTWGQGDAGPGTLPTGTYYYQLDTPEGRDAGPFIWVQR